jgi:hypothetical protein
MKRLLVCTGLLIAATLTLSAQPSMPMGAPKGPPKSPPATATATIAGKAITITYSSPRVNGRVGHIFTKDGLISHDPHYPVWRAGANAATSLHTEADLDIGGLTVPKGDYSLFVDITDPDNWVLIVSKQTGKWGLSYDNTLDLGQVKMNMAPAFNFKGSGWYVNELRWQERRAGSRVRSCGRPGCCDDALRWKLRRGMPCGGGGYSQSRVIASESRRAEAA